MLKRSKKEVLLDEEKDDENIDQPQKTESKTGFGGRLRQTVAGVSDATYV